MNLKELLDSVYVDLPNEYYADFDFEENITAMELGRLGFILAVGFDDGSIIICDSETGNNRKEITGHKSAINSLSFSHDNKYLISGDTGGVYQIVNILTKEVIVSDKVNKEVFTVKFSPFNPDEYLIHYGNQVKIFNMQTKETKVLPEQVTLLLWEHAGLIIINEQLELNIYNENLERIGQNKMSFAKKIPYMCISQNQKMICIINVRGEGYLYDMVDLVQGFSEDINFRNDFKDRVSELKYTCCVFDRNDEHLIFSSNTKKVCKLIIYEIDRDDVKQELEGPSEPVNHIIFHPDHPVIYTAGSPSIRVWTPTYQQSWAMYTPGFEHLEMNVDYEEKEDEFDIDDSIHMDIVDPVWDVDVLTPVEHPPSDILRVLPLDYDDLIKKRKEMIKKKEEKEKENAQEK